MRELHYTFFGCRGSHPVSSKRVMKYGGNTACLLCEAGDDVVILDAGTGLVNVGDYLKESGHLSKNIKIFLTHLHLDHIMGLPFFHPVFDKRYTIDIHYPQDNHVSFEDAIYRLFHHPYSPIGNDGIKAKINFHQMPVDPAAAEHSVGGDLKIRFIKERSHPKHGVFIYKIGNGAGNLVFATDVESPNGFEPDVLEFIKGTDVLIHDSQYFDTDYFGSEFPKKGFGHSTASMAVKNAIESETKKLFLFHYDPEYSDSDLERMLGHARDSFRETFLSEELKKFTLRS